MNKLGEILIQNPFFGLTLTLTCYILGQWAYKVTKWTVLQSILAGSLLIILVLHLTGISFEQYAQQNSVLEYILPISVVALAVPLYRNIQVLKKYWIPVLIGIGAGTAITMISLIFIGKLMGTDYDVILSMVPKSATNAIAIQVSEITGGIPSLTVALVVITGAFGGSFGPEILNIFGVKNKIARGVAMGSMTHAVGTARAFKESETEGIISSLALAITGTITAFLSPIFISIFL